MEQKHFENKNAKDQEIDKKKKFVVIDNTPVKKYCEIGHILSLTHDDNTSYPQFRNLNKPTQAPFYVGWHNLYYKEEEEKETESPLVSLLKQYLDLQKKNKEWEIEVTISAKRK